MLEAAEVVRSCGAEPVLLVPVVDRGGTVGALAAEAGIAYRALVTAPDLGFPYEKDA
jgi:orotate phosphoribosyltransferase